MSRSLGLGVTVEAWPIAGSFTISRGSRTEAVVVVATLSDGNATGRGECVPYARYGESVEGVLAAIEALRPALLAGVDRAGLQTLLPPGAARNALDCAFWDLECKRSNRRIWERAAVDPGVLTTVYTLSLGSPDAMARAAAAAAARPILKVKLGGDGDDERIAAVRAAAAGPVLVVDANEAWTPDNWHRNLDACVAAGVVLLEQPLPAGRDDLLDRLESPIPVCADESFHDRTSFSGIATRYRAVNIKLDKAGGLTEALACVAEARDRGLQVMVGCMLGTSLSMAPATVAAAAADFVDVDGPLLLARDREPGLRFEGSRVHPPEPALWG